jgi:ABC-2 type transport system ATP-binding protein
VERQHKTVLLTTHDLQEMETLCDRVGILENGRLRAVGAPADLIREASASIVYQLELVGQVNGLVEDLRRLPSVLSARMASQTASATVLELTLADAPGAELWAALATRNASVKRCAPKDDGLVTLLKQSGNQSETQRDTML